MTPTTPPEMVKPMTKISWEYVNPGELANEGIDSADDLRKMSEQIMSPIEQPSVLSALAKGVSGRG